MRLYNNSQPKGNSELKLFAKARHIDHVLAVKMVIKIYNLKTIT